MALRRTIDRGKSRPPEQPPPMDEPVAIEPHVRSMNDGGGAVLLDLREGRYYSLNGVAAGIWTRAEKGMTLAQILAELQATYQLPVDRLAADLIAFVRSMEAKGLLRASA